ncbi:MAG TPA: hypothetical protein VF868_02045 [Bacteroidia bacterium]
MKYIFILFTSVFLSCSSEKKEAPPSQTSATGDSLSADQIAEIKRIHSTFKEVYPVSIKELIENFKHDPDVKTELGVWVNMANAYESYLNTKQPQPDLNTRKEIFSLILNRSMMPAEEALKAAQPKLLDQEEAQRVMSFYKAEPIPMDQDSIHSL